NSSHRPDMAGKECFPEAVRFWVDHERRITEIPTEPIAADARPGKDGKNNSLLKLLAGILGVNYDDLRRRAQERKQRQRDWTLSGMVALLIVMGYISGTFWNQRNDARTSA